MYFQTDIKLKMFSDSSGVIKYTETFEITKDCTIGYCYSDLKSSQIVL